MPGDQQQLWLFEVPGAQEQRRPTLNDDAARIARQNRALLDGVHPLALVAGTGVIRIHPDSAYATATKDNAKDRPLRCGTCVWRTSGQYPKCMFRSSSTAKPSRFSHGPATDVRAWWPACTDHQAKP